MLKSDRNKIKIMIQNNGMKRVSLDKKDKLFIENYTKSFIDKNPECKEDYFLIYEQYTLQLKVLYLGFLMDIFDLKSQRIQRYIKEASEIRYKFNLKNYEFYSDYLSIDGYEVCYIRNNKKYNFRILEIDFITYILNKYQDQI